MSVQVLSPEDQARANLYGLLARLFYAPPDAELLRSLAAAEDIEAADGDASDLAAAWAALKASAAHTDAESVREEYEGAFVGTGKAEITLYATAYLGATEGSRGASHPLVLLRDFLARHGLARKEGVHEPEDHIASLCEVMRHLIVETNDLDAQREFYKNFVAQSTSGLCAAIRSSRRVHFYAPVARFAAAFFELEQQAVKMD